MAHEPKLTVYVIQIKTETADIEHSNRMLFRYLINEVNNKSLEDSFIFMEVFKKFIQKLDQPEMFSDDRSKKSITANQPNISDNSVAQNINSHFNNYIIEGVIEGGQYGRIRNKTSTINKLERSSVSDRDAITDNFYFFIYMPPSSNKMILMIQSYEGDSIDSVFKVFWKKFLSVENTFKEPTINRYIPDSIISSFKDHSTISGFKYSTDLPSKTLFGNSIDTNDKNFKVTIKITAVDGDFSITEFEEVAEKLNSTKFSKWRLDQFKQKKGSLRDAVTNKQSPFELDSNFHVKPVILLSKFINFPSTRIDFDLIKDYCFKLLEEIKPKIYPQHAVQNG